MLQGPLPPECLLIILHFLFEDRDSDTMARLLCVSKTFCATTLPFLYGDCFDASSFQRWRPCDKSPTVIASQMIRTLLHQVHHQDTIPDLLKTAYLSQDDQDDLGSMAEPLPPPVFKYGHFMRKIVPQWNFFQTMFDFFRNDSPVMNYAATHHLFDQYVAQGILSNDIHDDSRNQALEDALKMDLHRQLIWTLCQDHSKTIEELYIPLSDIRRHIDHVDQFTSLSKVTFSLEHIPWPSRYRYKDVTQEDRDRHTKEWEDIQDHFLKAMVQFVQRHISIHKNVLKKVEVPLFTYGTRQHSSLDVKFEIMALLPPLVNPRSISGPNIFQFAARREDVNLSYVESITLQDPYLTRNEEVKVFELLSKQPPFLPRCRVLKELRLYTLGPDMFQWAVSEKKQRDEAQEQERITGQHFSTRQHGHHHLNNINSSGNMHLIPLVPLRSVSIRNKEPLPLLKEVDDIAFAFSESLEEFSMYIWLGRDRNHVEDLANAPQVTYGRGWDLPRLQVLDFSVNHFQLHFDMDGLGRCRALESLRLKDDIMTYNPRDIRSWSPVIIPRLKRIDLQGLPALRFNMDSLHHSPCLEQLTLGMVTIEHQDGNFCYIPSAEELDFEDTQGIDHEPSGTAISNQGLVSIGRGPRYTWDWYLPNLCSVQLEAVFALKFDFQWLQHLPNLQRLHLDTRSSPYESPRARRITLRDLSKGQQLQQQDRDDSGSDRYITEPKLETLDLFGHWIFEEKVLETLCLFVAPNLRRVDFERDCVGYTLQEWIPLARRMPRIETMSLNLLLSHAEVRETTGLIPQYELQDEHRNKKLLKYSLYEGTFFDILES
ncbi:MAG: hypothetical protein J3Q66DRAFT_333227 [Benniella sp.]|nr:MAG: hypothetical protein J3Q66DRAFT_333227 [Benniella sp.]